MGIRVQPNEIDIPPKDPFRNDLLNRRESVEVLTTLIGSIEGPCVLGIDAAWGNGKTTFLGMLYQHLADEGFPVAKFNAWASDYSSDPFVALSAELTNAIRARVDESSSKEMLEDAEKRTKDVLKHMVPGLLRSVLAQIPMLGPVATEAIDSVFASYSDAPLSAYKEAKGSVEAFQAFLGKMAKAVSKPPENRPLVLLIDELDRCRPPYAVELLEVAKHLFSVDGIIFVLAVNRGELAHSVRALYGGEFDALGYLGRFFDVEYRLPEPDRTDFIKAIIQSVGIPDYLERTEDKQAVHEFATLEPLFGRFFGDSSVSLRTVARAIHHLGLVFAALPDNLRILADMSAVLLILRTFDRNLYYRFVKGQVSDLDVVDSVYKQLETDAVQAQEIAVSMFEAWLILAHLACKQDDALITGNVVPTPLEARYRAEKEKVDVDPQGAPPQSPEARRAEEVIRMVNSVYSSSSYRRRIPFKTIVQRIELISPEFGNTNSDG